MIACDSCTLTPHYVSWKLGRRDLPHHIPTPVTGQKSWRKATIFLALLQQGTLVIKTDICPKLFHEKYQFFYVFSHCAILVLKKLFQIIFFTHLCPVYFNRLDCVQKQPPSTWRSLSTAWISCKNNRCIFLYFFS